MEKEYCNNCDYRKKLPFSTLFECEKYDEILEGNPPIKCEKCKSDEDSDKKCKKKKDYIEVK